MNSKSPSKQIAIVAWQALPAIFPHLGSGVGGIETSSWIFANSLSGKSGLTSLLVVRSNRPLLEKRVEGVQIHVDVDRWLPMRRQVSQCIDAANRRLIRWRPRLLYQLPILVLTWPFRRRDPVPMQPDPRLMGLSPDVWIAMGVNQESAGVIATAKSQAKPSVLMIRSDADLNPAYGEDQLTFSPYGERSDVGGFALQQADQIVCQTETQAKALKHHFGRDCFIVRNPIDLPPWRKASEKHAGDRRGVMWVGRYENFHKRIDLAIKIAKLCPNLPFILIANPGDPDIETQVRSNVPANVQLLDYVPFSEMPERFAKSSVFLSTSSNAMEGFPNVLLQATASGTPTVSLDDFDGYIAKSKAGIVAEDLNDAAEMLNQFASGSRTIDLDSTMDYLSEHHETQRVMNRFSAWLAALD